MKTPKQQLRKFGKNTKIINMRVNDFIMDNLKLIAGKKQMSYQTLSKIILLKYIKKNLKKENEKKQVQQ